MTEGIAGSWPLILVGLAGISALIISFVLFWSSEPGRNRTISSFSIVAALVSVAAALVPALYDAVMPPTLTVYGSCQESSEYAPSTITCIVEVPEEATVSWEVNGVIQEGRGSSLELNVTNPGEVNIEATASVRTLFREVSDAFRTAVVLREPIPELPKEIVISHRFTDSARKRRSFQLTFNAEPGYLINDAKLEITGENAARARLRVLEDRVVVAGEFYPRMRTKGFQLVFEKAFIDGTVHITEVLKE